MSDNNSYYSSPRNTRNTPLVMFVVLIVTLALVMLLAVDRERLGTAMYLITAGYLGVVIFFATLWIPDYLYRPDFMYGPVLAIISVVSAVIIAVAANLAGADWQIFMVICVISIMVVGLIAYFLRGFLDRAQVFTDVGDTHKHR